MCIHLVICKKSPNKVDPGMSLTGKLSESKSEIRCNIMPDGICNIMPDGINIHILYNNANGINIDDLQE